MSERPAYMDAVTVLVRNCDKIHRRECRHAMGKKRTLPWLWAEGKTRAEVDAARINGLTFCQTCDPLGAVPR